MAYCEKHRRQHLDAGCSKCWEEEAAKAKAGAAVNAVSQSDVTNTKADVTNSDPPMTNAVKATYRYRDADKWRAYMRNYMRAKRGAGRLA